MYVFSSINDVMAQLFSELGHYIVVVSLDGKLALYDIQTFYFGIAIAEAFDYFLHSFRTPIDF